MYATGIREELSEFTDGECNVGTCGKRDVLQGTNGFMVIGTCHVFDLWYLRALVLREYSSWGEWGSDCTCILETKTFD